MKKAYWTIFILAAVAGGVICWYYIEQPPIVGPIVVHHVAKSAATASAPLVPSAGYCPPHTYCAFFATTTPITDIQNWQTYKSPDFSIEVPKNWIASTSMVSADSPVTGPVKTVSFSLPLPSGVADPVLYIMFFPHGFDLSTLQIDEPPNYLSTNGQFDFYFEMQNSDIDPAILAPLNLTNDKLILELQQALNTFSPEVSQLSASGWKTYTNSQYGFQINYPTDWSATTTAAITDSSSSGTGLVLILSENRKGEVWPGSFSVSVIPNSESLSLDQWILQNQPTTASGASLIRGQSTTTLYNISAKNLNVFGFDESYSEIDAMDHGYFYSLSFDNDNPNDPDFSTHFVIYQQILSTFKFTN